MSTYALSGTGTHALTAGTTGLEVTITTPSVIGGSGRSNPAAKYDQGLLRFSDGTGYWQPVAILGGPQFIPVPANASAMGYALLGGAAISVTEVIGGIVFFSAPIPSVASLSDVTLASLADGQVLTWNAAASKWENVTPSAAAVALSTASNVLAAPLSCVTAGTFYDAASASLAAGTWFVTATLTAHNSTGGITIVTVKLWDGTNVFASTEMFVRDTNQDYTFTLSAIVVLTGTVTVKASAAFANNSGQIKNTTASNGAPAQASQLNAIKVA